MKDKIIEYFKQKSKVVTIRDLVKYLKITEKDYPILSNILYELECSGFIIGNSDSTYMRVPKEYVYKHGVVSISTKENRYIDMGHGDIAIIPSKEARKYKMNASVFFETTPVENYSHQFIAKIVRVAEKPVIESVYLAKSIVEKDFNKNYFFVKINDEKIYIPNNYINGANIGDEVDVLVTYMQNTRVAKVKSIIEKKSTEHIFQVIDFFGTKKAKSISTVTDLIDTLPENAQVGDFLLYNIDKYGNAVYLRKMDELDGEIEAYAKEYGFDVTFDTDTINEANNLSKTIEEEEIKKRKDLRDLITITIDGEKSKDLDDAVSLEKNGENYCLYVSIADVSHYVKPGSNLFKNAYIRGTSIYPANKVIPMFPFQLSNGVCSLNEGEEKLTKTIKIEIDPSGKIVDYDIFKSVIKSNKKMSYEKVNALLNGENYSDDYLPYYNLLNDMNKLANILETRRVKRGYINLDIDEYEYDIDSNGEVKNIHVRERGKSQLMIENFMIIANEIAAKYLEYLEIPGAYRCHEAPKIDKLYKLKSEIKGIGKYMRAYNNQSSKILQSVIHNMNTSSVEESKYLSKIILSSMERAYFSTINIGHFGLALDGYAMFTSPIRRYADLINHLVIGYSLDGEYDNIFALSKNLEEMCVHTSNQEYASDSFEKNIDSMLMNKYLEKYADKELTASVIYIDKARSCIYIKTSIGIYGIISLGKKVKSSKMITIDGYKISLGDTIIVKYDCIQEYFNELIFKYISKDTNEIRSLKKVRREI